MANRNRLSCAMLIATILLSLFIRSQCESPNNASDRYDEAFDAAFNTLLHFFTLYKDCVKTTMPNRHFLLDDIQAYLFYPAKTTVGFSERYSADRKFFANMVGTTEFKHMLERDMSELRLDFLAKLKFCDESAMDQDMLRDLYDKDVEEHRLKR